ncbi:MAG: hypothetical protein OEZ36_08265, partial [Spirochaetota bacterium]|nr:hypothetical protein [Spirochaetota bacterium]
MFVSSKKPVLGYLILTLFILIKCQSGVHRTITPKAGKDPVVNKTLDTNSKNSTIKYFAIKTYSFKKKNFRFLRQNVIKDQSKLPKSVYYKVYISKSNKKIVRVD